ncbi:hypothetical protein J2Y38_000972 [Flavobacterium sp. 2755]|nr:hypothetical protein [Flavobacterium sp. 2755]
MRLKNIKKLNRKKGFAQYNKHSLRFQPQERNDWTIYFIMICITFPVVETTGYV